MRRILAGQGFTPRPLKSPLPAKFLPAGFFLALLDVMYHDKAAIWLTEFSRLTVVPTRGRNPYSR